MTAKEGLRLLVPPLLWGKAHDLKNQFHLRVAARERDVTYEINGFRLLLPAAHPLPAFQAAHRLYDRFLVSLGECLPDGAAAIDIGANVGDSAAALCAKASMRTVFCVDGSSTYFKYLEKNARIIASHGHDIHCLRAVVGPARTRARIVEAWSSGQVVVSQSGEETLTLDAVCRLARERVSRITVVKIDTDGFDMSVIQSGPAELERHEPLLFFEVWMRSRSELPLFVSTLSLLSRLGYSRFTILDNFGNIMLETEELSALAHIAGYVATLNEGISTRTIYHVDVFASTERNRDIHESAVRLYRKQYGLPPMMAPPCCFAEPSKG